MKPIRGSKYYSVYGIGVFTASGPPSHRVPYLGFRLVHDDWSRVRRGGSWDCTAGGARAAFRLGSNPGVRGGSLGFRLVREDE